jgi:hypothetical protein
LEEYKNTMKIWDVLAEKTKLDRNTCKMVVYALLYGRIVQACIDYKIEIYDVLEIQGAFDDYVSGRQR